MEKNKLNSKSENKQNNLPYTHCLNCGAELQGMYCHVCGQQATSKTPTVGEFFLEYINNAFIWDPKFFQTIWALLRRPGYLTKEYVSGKFVSQEHPLKLNMFLLFVFITLFALFAGTEKVNDSVQTLTNNASVRSGLQMRFLMKNGYTEKMKDGSRDTVKFLAPLFLAESYPEIISCIETIEDTQGEGLDKWVAAIPQVFIEDEIVVLDDSGYYQFNPELEVGVKEMELFNSVWEEMVSLINQYFPMLALFTAPFLSMSLSFVQRKSRLPRIHHFIFALHYTALLEVLMICIYLLHLTVSPPMEWLQCIMIIVSCLYLTVAFRQVYGIGNWKKAILKALFTSLVYFIIGLVIFIGIFFVACFIIAIDSKGNF
jgi:hypothetical protein